jgi:hypothetical protein
MKNSLIYLGIYIFGFVSPFVLGVILPCIVDYFDNRKREKGIANEWKEWNERRINSHTHRRSS